MKRVSVTELKNRLSRYLRLVKQGETLEVLERSVPIARIEGVAPGQRGGDAHLRRLIRDGVVSPPSGKHGSELVRKPPIPCRGDVAATLVEERRRR